MSEDRDITRKLTKRMRPNEVAAFRAELALLRESVNRVKNVPLHLLDMGWHKPGDPWFGTDHYEPECPYCKEPHYALPHLKLTKKEPVILLQCSRCKRDARFVGYVLPLQKLETK